MGWDVCPYENYPRTDPAYDDDKKIISAEVRPAALTPLNKFGRDKLRWLSGAAAFWTAAIGVYEMPIFEWEALFLPPVAFVSAVVAGHFGFGWLLKTRKRFSIDRKRFTVWRWGIIPRQYRRTDKLRFVLNAHGWAGGEARLIEFFKTRRSAKGKGTWMTPYFGDAVVLCIQYAGQDVPVMKFADKGKGELVLGRLAALGEALDSAMAGGNVRASSSEARGGDSIGGLKEKF